MIGALCGALVGGPVGLVAGAKLGEYNSYIPLELSSLYIENYLPVE